METINKVFINRKFNCSPTSLFDWLTKPDLLAQWFGPPNYTIGMVQTDTRINGKYSIELVSPGDQHFFIEGEYLEINAPNSLEFALRYTGLPTPPPESTVKIKLTAVGENECQLSLTQQFELAPTDMENRTKAWEYMLEKLANYADASS